MVCVLKSYHSCIHLFSERNQLSEQYIIESLTRGLHVLSQFDPEHPSLSMTDLIKRTGIKKATMYRILTTLEHAGYLEHNPETRQYRPSLRVLSLGFTALSRLDLRQLARPYLEQLAETLELTASLTILDGLDVVYIDRVRNREIVGVVLGLGSRIPANCSSMGKAMLAFLPQDELDSLLNNATLSPCTPQSMADLESFRRDLERVREEEVAFNIDELAMGLRAVAAPIFDRSGRAVAAINVSGSRALVSEERLRNELASEIRKVAHQISQLQSQ